MPTTDEIEAARQRLANGTGTAEDNATYYGWQRQNAQQQAAAANPQPEQPDPDRPFRYNSGMTPAQQQQAFSQMQANAQRLGGRLVEGDYQPIIEMPGGNFVSGDWNGPAGSALLSFDPYAGSGYTRPQLAAAKAPRQPAPPATRPGTTASSPPAATRPGTTASSPSGSAAPRPGATPVTGPGGTAAPRPGPRRTTSSSGRNSVGGYSDRELDARPDQSGGPDYPTGRVDRGGRSGAGPSGRDYRNLSGANPPDYTGDAGTGNSPGDSQNQAGPDDYTGEDPYGRTDDGGTGGGTGGGPSGGGGASGGGGDPAGSGRDRYKSAGGYTPDNGAANPYYNYPAGQGRPNSLSSNLRLDWSGNDPARMMRNIHQYAIDRGDRLDTDFAYDAGEQRSRAAALNLTGDELYAWMLDNPGYSPQEAREILRRQQTEGLQQTGEERQANYLNDEEQSGIKGNFDRQRGVWEAATKQLPYIQNDYRGRTQNAIASGGDRMRGAVDQESQDFNSAIGKDLNLSPEHQQFVGDALDYTEGNVRAVTNPEDLRVSQDYLRDYKFSPEDAEDYAQQAGRTAGIVGQAQRERLERDVAQSDTSNPLAVETALRRAQQQNQVSSADAINRARIQGKVLELQTTQGRESTRLGAEQDLSRLRSSEEMALGAQRLGAGERLEERRLGAERDISGRKIQTAQTTGAQRLGAEQYLTGADLANEQQQEQQALSDARYLSSTGINVESDIDAKQSQRAGQIAQNRQEAERYNQGQRYGRGTEIANTLSGRYRDVAGQRRQDLQSARNDVREQAGEANRYAAVGQSNRVGVMGAQFGAANAAAAGALSQAQFNDTKPKWYDKAAGGVSGFLGAAGIARGGIVTEPTYANVGENGPEAIIPLDNGDFTNPLDNGDFTNGANLGNMASPDPNRDAMDALPKPPGFWGRARRNLANYYGARSNDGGSARLWSPVNTYSRLGSLAGSAVAGGLNRGRIVTSPTKALIGESGPEAVIPLNNNPQNLTRPGMVFGKERVRKPLHSFYGR